MESVKKKDKLFILILVALSFVSYFNCLDNPFLLDDHGLVVNNPIIKSSGLLNLAFKGGLYDIPGIRQSKIPYDNMYRPLQLVSYYLDYKIWGLKPFGFHLTNILIHTLNGILVFYLFSLIIDKVAAKLASAFFITHPVQVSVVAYIAARADLLSVFFMLAAVIFFLKFFRSNLNKYYVLSLISGLAALFCRENAILLFLFILLVLAFLKAKPRQYIYLISFILLDIFYIWVRYVVFGWHAIAHASHLPDFLRLLNFFNIIPRYILILVFPFDLHFLRTTPLVSGFYELRAFFGLAFILFCGYLAIKYRRERPLLFCAFWFLLGIIPVFFFLDAYPVLGQALMAESWAYLASAGCFALFAFAILSRPRYKKLIFSCLVIFYVSLTLINNYRWKDSIKFYKNVLQHTSERNPLRVNLVNECLARGLYQEAWAEIQKFSSLFPESSDRYLMQGDYYYAVNEIPRAIDNYNAALIINKYRFQPYYGLSRCFQRQGEIDKAITFAYEAVKYNPYSRDSLLELADLYGRKKQFTEALQYYNMALKLDPSDTLVREKIRNAK